jgi:hypothetical protein
MEHPQLLHELATIATRFNTLNIAADEAKRALTNVEFSTFTGILSSEEKKILREAQSILSLIADHTRQSDVLHYFATEICKTTQKP